MVLESIHRSPESKSTVEVIRREFGGVAVDTQKYKRQGEAVLQ